MGQLLLIRIYYILQLKDNMCESGKNLKYAKMILFSKGCRGLASEEPLDSQAWKEGKGNEDPRERMQWGLLGPQVVLGHQAPQGRRDTQDHQVGT